MQYDKDYERLYNESRLIEACWLKAQIESDKERIKEIEEGDKAGVYCILLGLAIPISIALLYGLASLISLGIESLKPRDFRWTNKETLYALADSVRTIDRNGDLTPEFEVYKDGQKTIYELDLEAYCNQESKYLKKVD